MPEKGLGVVALGRLWFKGCKWLSGLASFIVWGVGVWELKVVGVGLRGSRVWVETLGVCAMI